MRDLEAKRRKYHRAAVKLSEWVQKNWVRDRPTGKALTMLDHLIWKQVEAYQEFSDEVRSMPKLPPPPPKKVRQDARY